MQRGFRFLLVGLCALFAVALVTGVEGQTTVSDATATFTYTRNMHPLGYSARLVPLDNTVPGAGVFNSDLAFWGSMAVQGTYAGFRLVDVSNPENLDEVVMRRLLILLWRAACHRLP